MHALVRCGLWLTILLTLGLLLPACSPRTPSKVTQENYDKIKNDMTLQQVEAILGPGTKEEGGDGSGVAAQFGVHVGGPERGGRNVDTYVWEAKGKTIKVHFVNGKVTNKQKEGF
ncbi:MAG TPA: hypothetical protein VNK04_02915 [Gemmataceae bacterium]|nr:hypothetical protein [Gemmataceae bacterium]